MSTTELQELIVDMPFSEEAKKEIIDRQATGAPAEDILSLVAAKLDEAERKLMESTAEGASIYRQAVEAYEKEVSLAQNEFDQKMDAIEAEGQVLGQELNKGVDEARMQELKEERANISA